MGKTMNEQNAHARTWEETVEPEPVSYTHLSGSQENSTHG